MVSCKLVAAAQLLLLLSTATIQVSAAVRPSAHSPPFYPSPRIDGAGSWEAAYVKARQFVDGLTIPEKTNLTTGTGWESNVCVGNTGAIPRIGFPALCLQDSPLGVRAGTYASVFPAGMNAAMSWDRKLIYARGLAMGEEFKGKGVNIALGPVAGPLGRNPTGGRNWEGFSPDPVLAGVGMFETISGIQDAGVVATAKHFIGNEQEHFRQVGESATFGFNITESLSSNIDDRTIHELYLWPFADAVRANVGAMMCSYQQLNNSYPCQNSKLLNGLLKDELDFQGFVMTDWGAHRSGVASSLAGLDMTMPGDSVFDSGFSYWGENLTLAIVNGSVPEWRLDDMATRIMAAYFFVGQDPKTYPKTNLDAWTTDTFGFANNIAMRNYGLVNPQIDVRGNHAQIIREVGAKSIVLLKNVDGVLPLVKPRQLAVFGSDAGEAQYGPNGCSDRSCDNGTLGTGWGSGTASYTYLVTPLEAIKARGIQDGTVIQSVIDDYAYTQINATATQATICLTFVNADSGEGYISVEGNDGDRNNLTIWHDGDTLIKTVAASCNNTVVVIHSVGAVLLEEWVDHPNVTAVLFAGLPGQESGNSLVDVLYGDVNPSGKLPFTIGKKTKDYGTDVLYTPNGPIPQQDFSEGLFIDYRHFDKKGIKPRYEFGYGLSYTKFKYEAITISKLGFVEQYKPAHGKTAPVKGHSKIPDLKSLLPPAGFKSWKIPFFIYPWLSSTSGVKKGHYNAPPHAYDTSAQSIPPAGGAPGGNPSLFEKMYEIMVRVTNVGNYDGEEVVQLYVETGRSDDPIRVLRGFEKVLLAKGQSTDVRITINRRDLARWDIGSQDWVMPNLKKEKVMVSVGPSSRILPLSGLLH